MMLTPARPKTALYQDWASPDVPGHNRRDRVRFPQLHRFFAKGLLLPEGRSYSARKWLLCELGHSFESALAV